MRFLLDESAEVKLARFLQSAGHDVEYVQRDFPVGLPDRAILERAHAAQRILITNDRDFGELVFRHQQPHSGVIYFRLPLDTTAAQKIVWLRQLLDAHQADLGRFIVVDAHGIRIA
jgi:predicted nuclease of predicted toxin-antitoxin system